MLNDIVIIVEQFLKEKQSDDPKLIESALKFLQNPSDIGWITEVSLVEKVHDADSLRVKLERLVDVRLLECYMPEVNKGTEKSRKLANKLTDEVKDLLSKSDKVFLNIPNDSDKIRDIFTFGRVLGYIICLVDGELIVLSQFVRNKLKVLHYW